MNTKIKSDCKHIEGYSGQETEDLAKSGRRNKLNNEML
jgi:hypothetical protein